MTAVFGKPIATFKYDVYELCALMETRPSLWDKKSNGFNNRELKSRLWYEVFSSLEPKYPHMNIKEQIRVGNSIRSRWNNLRDSFIRAVRKHQKTRPYLYADALQFLLKTKRGEREAESTQNIKEELQNQGGSETQDYDEDQELTLEQELDPGDVLDLWESDEPSTSAQEKMDCSVRIKREQHSEDDEMDVRRTKIPRIEFPMADFDEDQAFFHSILPHVREFSSDHKLEFRGKVIQIIRDMKDQAK